MSVQTSTLFKGFLIIVRGRSELGREHRLRPLPAPRGLVGATERLEGLRPEDPRLPVTGVEPRRALEGPKGGLRLARLQGDGAVLPPHLRLARVEADRRIEAREGLGNPPRVLEGPRALGVRDIELGSGGDHRVVRFDRLRMSAGLPQDVSSEEVVLGGTRPAVVEDLEGGVGLARARQGARKAPADRRAGVEFQGALEEGHRLGGFARLEDRVAEESAGLRVLGSLLNEVAGDGQGLRGPAVPNQQTGEGRHRAEVAGLRGERVPRQGLVRPPEFLEQFRSKPQHLPVPRLDLEGDVVRAQGLLVAPAGFLGVSEAEAHVPPEHPRLVERRVQDEGVREALAGVFEAFPGLNVVSVENGFGWAASMMWRLDASWQVLKSEVPDLKRAPSEYVREHCYWSTQPMEEPHQARYFLEMLEQLGLDDNLMFASDYPHWDWDSPEGAFPVNLPDDLKSKIYYENGRRLYRLPAPAAQT